MSVEIQKIALKYLKPTQGNLKKRSSMEKRRILASLEENELMYPLYVALIDQRYHIIDGHFRKEVLAGKYGEDYEMPVVVFTGMTLEEAKEQCLVLSAQYGVMSNVVEWLKLELPNLDSNVMVNLNMPLPKLDVDPTKRIEGVMNKCPICGQ